uniref:Uncharacterized protein n=1 Tax=Glossina austeni TaxID=7395 RepID=A0A1A9UZH5_GLOAU
MKSSAPVNWQAIGESHIKVKLDTHKATKVILENQYYANHELYSKIYGNFKDNVERKNLRIICHCKVLENGNLKQTCITKYSAKQGFLRNKISIPCFNYSKTPSSPRQLIETKPTYSTSSGIKHIFISRNFCDQICLVSIHYHHCKRISNVMMID